MTPESTLREQKRLGNTAKGLADNEAFIAACAEIEKEETEKAIFAKNEKDREAARVTVLGLHEIRSRLKRIEERGHTASKLMEYRQAQEKN